MYFIFYHFHAKILVSIFSRHSSSTTINSILTKFFVLGNTTPLHIIIIIIQKKRLTDKPCCADHKICLYFFTVAKYISYEYYSLAKVHESSEKSFSFSQVSHGIYMMDTLCNLLFMFPLTRHTKSYNKFLVATSTFTWFPFLFEKSIFCDDLHKYRVLLCIS